MTTKQLNDQVCILWEMVTSTGDEPIENLLEIGYTHAEAYSVFPEDYQSWFCNSEEYGEFDEMLPKFQALCRKWLVRKDLSPDSDEREEEEDVFTCNCCGEENIDNDDGVDCQSCGESVCDECMIADEDDPHCKTDRCKKCEQDEEEDEDRQYFKVADGGNPDVDYFDTLDEAKAFCDKHESLDYGLIMLCDWEKKEIGDWGDFEEEEEVEFDTCVGCEKTVQVEYKNGYSIANCDWCDKMLCRECLDGGVEGKCVYCVVVEPKVDDNSLTYEEWKCGKAPHTFVKGAVYASWNGHPVKVLKSICKERKIKNYSKLKKEELLQTLFSEEKSRWND